MPNRTPDKFLPKVETTSDGRVHAVVVARESSIYGSVLMEGMIGQTVGSNLHLPGAKEVLEEGIKPLEGTSSFETVQYRKNRTNAVVFEHCGVVYVYSLGSAAMTNLSDTDNVYIELLCDVLEAYRPLHLYVATFNRLLRSLDFAGKLLQSCKQHVGLLHCGTTTIDPRSPAGKAMWATFSMVADMERDSIVQRLFAGQVNKFLDGRYVFGNESIPPGYAIGDDGYVRPDTSLVPAVRHLIEMLADKTFTARDIVDQAGELGLSSPTIRRIHGPDATFANLCRADSRVASLMDWLPTYETGVAEIFHKNPFPGATAFRTLPVEGASATSPGFVRFVYDWGLPEGGWADPDVIHAAATRTKGRKERRSGGAAHRRRKPFSGWVRWRDDDSEYWLTGTSSNYLVMAQAVTDDTALDGTP